MTSQQPTVDPTTTEIIRNLLIDISEEMQAMVMNAAYAQLWQEGGDLSCAVLSADAEVVAQNERVIPIHVATMMQTTKEAIEQTGGYDELDEGDILIQNNPYSGNNHLNDVLVSKPVFAGGVLVGFAAVRGHWIDIGGSSPTNYTTDTRELIQEGLVIPPGKLFRRGERNDDLYNTILANVREREAREGDLSAQLSGVRRGEQRLARVAEKYGAKTVRQAIKQILDNEEKRMRTKIAEVPDGQYVAEDYMDGDGVDDNLAKIRVAVEVDGDRITVDFDGTASQFKGGVNAPKPVTDAATHYACKVIFDPGEPGSSGAFRPIEIMAPEGTILNPTYPAPVVLGNHETASRVLDAVVKAIAEIDPELAFGAGEGGSPGIMYHSRESGEMNRLRAPGGMGACHKLDGVDALRSGVGNVSIQSYERVEEDHDFVRTEEISIVPDTGGAGQYRGGNAAQRAIRFEHDVTVYLTLERTKTQPYGIAGGCPGRSSQHYYVSPDGDEEPFPSSKATTDLDAGSTVVFQAPGGGGYGDPQARSPERVLQDVKNGYVTPQTAREEYGVAITSEMTIDYEETQTLREQQ